MTGTNGIASKHEQAEREGSGSGFRVELGLYGLILALALALRLWAVGRWPLLDEEAGLALAAWRVAHGLPASLRGHSPLLFHLNTLLFFLTGGSDELARSWCVLFGSLLVLLPYGLRRQLGRIGAVASSLLLAISPSFTYFSRAVDGSVVVAFCALGLCVVIAKYLETGSTISILAATSLLVVALLAGPAVYTLLTVLLSFPLFLWFWARLKDREPLEELKEAWDSVCSNSAAWRQALMLALVLFLAAGLAFASSPAGLQMALDQFGQWLTRFHFLGKSPWYLALQLLLLYETLPVLLGLASLCLVRARGGAWNLLVRYWFGLALLFSLVPGYRPPSSVLLILVPAILAAGQAVQNLWSGWQEVVRRPLFLVLVLLSMVVFAAAYVQLATYLALPVSTYLLRMLALCVFLVSAYALVWSLLGSQIPVHAAGVSLLLLLLLLLIRTEVRLNYAHARDPLEPMVGVTVSPDVLELARTASQLSSHLEGDPRVMAWEVDQRLEVPLGWYLRSLERVSYVPRVAAEPEVPAVIIPDKSPGPARYVGLHFRLHSTWAGGKYPVMDWLRWWIGYRSILAEYQTGDEVVLWVRRSQQ